MANQVHLALLKSGIEVWNAWRAENSDILPDLRHAILWHADLRQANLEDADLRYSILRRANLSYADLRFADLRHTDVRRTNFGYAMLWGADLSHANLKGASFREASFRWINLHQRKKFNDSITISTRASIELKTDVATRADMASRADVTSRAAMASRAVVMASRPRLNDRAAAGSRAAELGSDKPGSRAVVSERNGLVRRDKLPAHGSTKENDGFANMLVFFGTDRNRKRSSKAKEMFGTRRSKVSYGYCEVSIPRDHRMGKLESPSIVKLDLFEDPRKHVVLRCVHIQSKVNFFFSL